MVSTDSHDQDGGKKGTRGGTERKGMDAEALKSGFGPKRLRRGQAGQRFEGKICDVSIEASGRGREPLEHDESVVPNVGRNHESQPERRMGKHLGQSLRP